MTSAAPSDLYVLLRATTLDWVRAAKISARQSRRTYKIRYLMKHRGARVTRPAGAKTVRFRTIRTRNPSRYRSVAHHLALYLCLLLVVLIAQACGGEQTPTPTATPEAVASPSATSTHTPTPDPTPTDEPPTSTATLEATPSPSPTQTDTPTPDPTPTEVPPTSTATLEPAPSPSPTQTDTPTPDPTPTEVPPTSTATLEPTPSPSPTQTDTPTPVATPTEELPTPTETPDAVESRSPDLLGQTYSNPNDGFEIRPPRGWAVDDSGLLGTKVIFSSETPDLHDETPVQANINILTVPAQGITLEELAAVSKEQFKIAVTNFTLLGETFRVVDDSEAHVFEYTYSQGVFPLRGMQLIVVDEDKAYAITATALSATWDKYEAAFDASLRSFRTLADSPSANGTAAPDADSVDGGESPAPTDTPEAVDSQSPAQPSQPYSNSMDGFEIQPPDGWVVDERGFLGSTVVFHGATPDLHGETPFFANIVVRVGPTNAFALEEIAEESIKQSSLELQDFDLLGDESVIVNGQTARLFELTYVEGALPLKALYLLVVYEDKAYAITATALDAAWDKYESAFDASLRSLRFLADSQSPAQPSQPYSNSMDGFEIQPPDGWAVDDSGAGGTSVIFYITTPDLHGDAPFRANMNVSVWPTDGIKLEELVPAIKEAYKISGTDFTLLEETSPIVNDLETYVFDYTHSQGGLPLRVMQLAAIYEDKIYAITATALDGTWENYEAVFEASFRSFRVLADSPAPTETPEAVDSQSPDRLDQPYSDSTNGFEIRPPSGWTVDQSGLLGTKVVFYSKTPDLHGKTPFSASINVLTGPAQDSTLEEIIGPSREQVAQILTDFTLLEETSLIVNGLEAHIFEYTYSLGVFPLRVMQMLVVYENRVYAITTGSLEAAWDKYEGVFEASLGSFRVLDAEDTEGP